MLMMDGSTQILEPSPKFQKLGKNSLGKGENTRATPAFSDGEIFIRTYRHLWCISAAK